MAFTSEQIDELVELISSEVPVAILLEINDPYVPLSAEQWRKEGLEECDGGRGTLARRIVHAYRDRNAVTRLGVELYRRLYRDPVLARRLYIFTIDPEGLDALHQAQISRRARSANFRASRLFWAEAAPRVCAIVTEKFGQGVLGTGFLVGPDLVVTAYHTLSHLIANGAAVDLPSPKYAVFDFHEGPQIPGPPPRESERWVEFADDWLVESSPHLKGDGTIMHPNDEETALLRSHLDFALIRLAKPIGLEAVAENGGRRRHWFQVPDTFPALAPGQRVTLPQHPYGLPQDIDFGTYIEPCPSHTRLRSFVESAHGTSGAPFFANLGTRFPLVGMHNAAYAPAIPGQIKPGTPPAVLNQQISFERIADQIRGHLTSAGVESGSPFWSTNQDTPTPIVGRARLIRWIQQGMADSTSSPVFAATGSGAKIGRTFSMDILRAMLRDSEDRVVELGARGVTLPATVPDLVRTIFDQLALPLHALKTLPPRPSPESTEYPDKVTRWASTDVPRWLLNELAQFRRREGESKGELADPVAPIDPNVRVSPVEPLPLDASAAALRWGRIWIAIRLDPAHLERSEIIDFIAALSRLPAEDDALAQGAPIRLLFLGALPDFASGLTSDARELLNPMEISAADAVVTVGAIATSLGKDLSSDHLGAFQVMLGAIVDTPPFQSSETRLAAFQDVLRRLVPRVREMI